MGVGIGFGIISLFGGGHRELRDRAVKIAVAGCGEDEVGGFGVETVSG